MAAVYHRRFDPYDVDGPVAYSAPNNIDDRDDSAHVRSLDKVDTPADHEALASVQRILLLHRTELARSTGGTRQPGR